MRSLGAALQLIMNKMSKKNSLIAKGTMRIHPRGFGFLVPEDKERFPLDIFIPPPLINGAVDGDVVEVEVNPYPTSDKGPEGQVIAIIKRSRSHLTGIIIDAPARGAIYAYAPLLGKERDIRIQKKNEQNVQVGDRILIQIIDWGSATRESLGEMVKYIGHISDPAQDIAAAVEEYELPAAFSIEAEEEAKSFGAKAALKEIEGREDFRALECFTIDPETARDFDDALSLHKDRRGHYHLGVHIADVSHYVRPGTALDKEALHRCNSTYFPGSVLPMLPHELSSELCSLKPRVNRLTASVMMEFDRQGELKNYRITRSVIRSQKRFSYPEALQVLEGKEKSAHKKTLLLMVELCHLLKKRRQERGSIEFAIPSLKVEVDAEGNPTKISVEPYDITHQLVEEFMLKANEIVATHLANEKKPLTYRVHPEPAQENMQEFITLARAYGFSLSHKPTAPELQNLFDKAREAPFGQFLATSFIRAMRLATYSTQNIGHYGLGLEYYTHFTSPIRRYADLIVHRALFEKSKQEGGLEAIALRCSERERLSARAENDVLLLKKLRLLQSILKDSPSRRFEATITLVKPAGFVFEVAELMLEGFLPLRALEEDFFNFDARRLSLIGLHTDKVYRCGDKITIGVQFIDFIVKEVEWTLLATGGHRMKKSKRRLHS